MTITSIDEYPIPFEQEEINNLWKNAHIHYIPPSIDEAHEEYTKTIANQGEWEVFRVLYPFANGEIVFWNRAFGRGFMIDDMEGEWHEMVNLFAEIVDTEGDCRDSKYTSSLQSNGEFKQHCKECNSSWITG